MLPSSKVILMDDSDCGDSENVITFSILSQGVRNESSDKTFSEYVSTAQPDLLTLIYIRYLGNPKGVMLTHGNDRKYGRY